MTRDADTRPHSHPPRPRAGLAMRSRRTGVCGPVLLCQACGKRIANAGSGVVLWDGAKQDAAPLFAHVGGCCRRVEAGAGVHLDSLALSAWLIYLANGCKLRWLRSGKLAVALAGVG